MSNSTFLQPGCAYSFEYPRHNYRQLPLKAETRRIVVGAIRDVQREPLDPVTLSLNPLLQRGRWLVTGKDLDKEGERSFYIDSMTKIRALGDDDLQPLKDAGYLVIEQTHVAYASEGLAEALAFRADRESGVICAVLCRGPRTVSPQDEIDPPLLADCE